MVATRQWTVDEVLALPNDGNRYELIDGELLVTPSPSWTHQHAVSCLLRPLADWVDQHALGVVMASPADIRLTPATIVQPDLFVVPARYGHPGSWTVVDSLLLAVEIVSPGSSRTDRGRKRRFFQRQQVPEYWVVDPDARLVERWRPGDDRPEILADRLSWQPAADGSAFELTLPEFFTRVTGAP